MLVGSQLVNLEDYPEMQIHVSKATKDAIARSVRRSELEAALVEASKRNTEIGNKYAIQSGEVDRLRSALGRIAAYDKRDSPKDYNACAMIEIARAALAESH